MKATHSEDLEFLRRIRGRFQDTTSHRQGERFVILLVAATTAVLFSALLHASPPLTTGRHHVFYIAMILGSVIMGAQLWRALAVEYEFTGEEIIERRAGRIHGRILISKIVETRVLMQRHRLIVRTQNANMSIRIFPLLNEAIQRGAASPVTDGVRRETEAVTQEVVSRLKRRQVVAAVVLMLFAFAIVFAYVSFRGLKG